MDEIREDKLNISPDIIDVLLVSFDSCHLIVKSIEGDNTEGDDDFSSITEKLNALMKLASSSSEEVGETVSDSTSNEDDELSQLVSAEVESQKKSSDGVEVNSAALESMNELVAEGIVDPSAVENIGTETTEEQVSDTGEEAINSAAMDSLNGISR